MDLYKKRNLAELLENLVKVEGIEWIRLHYAFPTGFPMDVLELMKREPKICNYIDIPLQHISDNILKSMRRGTTKEKTTKLLKEFRAAVPGMTIRTTLIVGYPGETQEDFEIMRDWVQEMKFERLGCFTYSHEENTHAYLLEDDVPEEVTSSCCRNHGFAISNFMGFESGKSGANFQMYHRQKRGSVFHRKN